MTQMPARQRGGTLTRAGAALLLLVALYVAQSYSYLLFHSVVEFFSVAVAMALLMLTWNARFFVERHFLLWLGIGYGFVASLDLLHTLVYRGMGVFEDMGADPATQLWIAARSIQALVLLVSPVFLDRKLNVRAAFAGFTALVTLVILSIFAWDVFPSAYNDAAGRLTTFKVVSEYIICVMLAVSAWLIYARRTAFDRHVLWLLIGSIVSTILAELSFTLYTDVYGFTNLLGHYFKLVAFYLLYKAVVEANLRRPYEVLFRDLTQREEELERSQQQLEALNQTLEQRVVERTEQVRMLARQLAQAESHERERLAGILHDDVQQMLAAARMRLQMASSGRADSADTLTTADEYLREAIEVCRCLAVEVSPGIVRGRGLSEALEWLGVHMGERHGLQVELQADEDISLDDHDSEELVFRVVRELLFNVVKHAGVDHASVDVTCGKNGQLSVTVRDRGQGFDATDEATIGEGFGLGSVRDRVEMLGGSCVISSEPGVGTSIEIAFPCASA